MLQTTIVIRGWMNRAAMTATQNLVTNKTSLSTAFRKATADCIANRATTAPTLSLPATNHGMPLNLLIYKVTQALWKNAPFAI
jgi:hypothetical protein